MSDYRFSDLLRQRTFVQFWITRLAGTAANQMLMVAVGWQMYELTGSAWDLGLVGLYQFLPALLLWVPAGHVADRYHRGRIVAACLAMQSLAAVALAYASNAHTGLTDTQWTLVSNRALILAVCSSGLLTSPASAAPIYRWTDEAGNTHYSTTPDDPRAKSQALPELRHENIDANIRKLQSETPESCDHHGGPDCSRGADADGSVVCLDGYRGAKLPFQFHCMEARLKSEMMLRTAGDGEHPTSRVPRL